MSNISVATATVIINDAGERDLLVNALRVGSARAKLIANTLDSIQASVRQRVITPSDALAWTKQTNVLEWIQLGPEVGRDTGL
jgi:hypothetical protein